MGQQLTLTQAAVRRLGQRRQDQQAGARQPVLGQRVVELGGEVVADGDGRLGDGYGI